MNVPMSVPNLPTKDYNNNHAYDMQKLHHNYIFPLGKSIKNPHIVAASFSENHDELVCYDCTVIGPHNTQLHRLSNLDEAFRYRFESINKQIHQSLVPKRAQLIGQIVRLDHRLDEIKTVKGVIERDIRNEYAGIMERLRSAEGVKTAVL